MPVSLLGGFPTAAVTRAELAAIMTRDCLAARAAADKPLPKLVFSSNGQGIALAAQDKCFHKAMMQADIIHADGMPVVFASRFLGAHRLPERIATTDFFHDAARAAAVAGLRFFILGGSETQNLNAVEAMKRLYPGIAICGRHNGYFPPEKNAEICREIVECGTDVLWVGLGKPKQEHWSVENRERLKGVGWVKTCGGLYAFLTDEVSRAPDWMQKAGLEWLYRTMQEPGRLAWRYLTTNVIAAYCLLSRSEWRQG
jgi:exopolysaccharide biosynthesis WecB/TagA/CpsF family protein